MMLLVFLFLSETKLSEVGGLHLMSAVTAHQNTYLFYRTGPRGFDLYFYDWDKSRCFLVEPDGRVKPVLIAYLVPHEGGVAIVDIAVKKIFVLSETGEYLETILLRDYLGDDERPTFATPGQGNSFYLTTRVDDRDHYGLFDVATKTWTTLYRVDRDGTHYLLPFDGGHLVIRDVVGEVQVLDSSFKSLARHDAPFERAGFTAKSTKSIRDPFKAAGVVTMSYKAKTPKGRIDASARFSGENLLFADNRALAFSPDGAYKMVYSYTDDEIRIRPSTFSFPEVRFPPTPGDKGWPPE